VVRAATTELGGDPGACRESMKDASNTISAASTFQNPCRISPKSHGF